MLRQADILHVSNEASFDPTCPVPNPYKNRFLLQRSKYIGLFDDVGVDVVELTGNHILDHGTAAMLYSLNLYRQHHIAYFGGGANLAEARKPLLMEDHGNKIAFVGCNAGEPPEPLAAPNAPGANPCDWTQLVGADQAAPQPGLPAHRDLPIQGRLLPDCDAVAIRGFPPGRRGGCRDRERQPIACPVADGIRQRDLHSLWTGKPVLRPDGAINPPVPGCPCSRRNAIEFMDRHVFYDGRYISTELLTSMLEDYARPRPMTPDERAALLQAYFGYSGWLPLVPTPAPELTPTLYPLLTRVPLPTHTPLAQATPSP